jgi:hypothetical protein
MGLSYMVPESTGVRSLGVRLPGSNFSIWPAVGLVRLWDALDSPLGEFSPSHRLRSNDRLRILLNCEVAVPSSRLATVPKVPAQRYRGTIRYHRFAQYPSPSSV